MDMISNYIDPDLLYIIVGIGISMLLLKLIFKYVNGFRVLKIIFTVAVVASIIFMSVKYIQKNEEIFSKQNHRFVYGKADFIAKSINKIDLTSIRTSFQTDGKGKLVINSSTVTEVIDKSNGKTESIRFDDLNTGDYILIYCEENMINENSKEVTAVKIIRKYASDKKSY